MSCLLEFSAKGRLAAFLCLVAGLCFNSLWDVGAAFADPMPDTKMDAKKYALVVGANRGR